MTFFSIHRYGQGFYPGTGAADETGTGPGLGYTLNAPVRFGTSRQDYHGRFSSALEKAADEIKPELVLSAPASTPTPATRSARSAWKPKTSPTLTKHVLDVAKTHAKGRLVSCLEGGYNLDALAESVQTHLEELLAYKA